MGASADPLCQDRGNCPRKEATGKGAVQGELVTGGWSNQDRVTNCTGSARDHGLDPATAQDCQAPSTHTRADPQQQIFPKARADTVTDPVFPTPRGHPDPGHMQVGGGQGRVPSKGQPALQGVVGPHVAIPSHTDSRPAAQPRTKTTRERSAPRIRDLASAQPFEVGSAKSDYY